MFITTGRVEIDDQRLFSVTQKDSLQMSVSELSSRLLTGVTGVEPECVESLQTFSDHVGFDIET